MILQREIIQKSQEWKVPSDTVDKDYVLGHFLSVFIAHYKNELVFKGGTCLRKCYLENYRFSEDLDFTSLDKSFVLDQKTLQSIAKTTEENTGILFSVDKIKPLLFQDEPKGYQVYVKYWGANHSKNQRPLPANRWHTKIKLEVSTDEILLLDSLHGLYPPMTNSVPEDLKFKLFIEAFSMIKLGDGADGIFTKGTDVRMLRRMLRDRDHRNHSPKMTLGHWHFVRKGELRDMIPYINTVDYVMNGGLSFELPVLKTVMSGDFPDPKWFLNQGRLDAYIRGERVRRILESLMPVKDLSSALIPEDSHLREFIGGLNL